VTPTSFKFRLNKNQNIKFVFKAGEDVRFLYIIGPADQILQFRFFLLNIV